MCYACVCESIDPTVIAAREALGAGYCGIFESDKMVATLSHYACIV